MFPIKKYQIPEIGVEITSICLCHGYVLAIKSFGSYFYLNVSTVTHRELKLIVSAVDPRQNKKRQNIFKIPI